MIKGRDRVQQVLELNEPWPDSERAVRAEAAQAKGAAWATACRAHANNGVGHYYMHLAFAHLQELILEHGHLQTGNDEVLEKGNRDMKRFRDLTYWGGESSKEAQAKTVTQTRYKLVRAAQDGEEAVYEAFTTSVPRTEASWVACMKMQVAADLIAARRPQHSEVAESLMTKRRVAKRARDAVRDACKDECIVGVQKAATCVALV